MRRRWIFTAAAATILLAAAVMIKSPAPQSAQPTVPASPVDEGANVLDQVIAPGGDVLQAGRLIAVQGDDPLQLTVDAPGRGTIRFTAALGATGFYYLSAGEVLALAAAEAPAVARQVADARGEVSVNYAGTPDQPEQTLAVLFASGFDADALSGEAAYLPGGGSAAVSKDTVSVAGVLAALEIDGSRIALTLDAGGVEAYAFTFDADAVDWQALRGDPPEFAPVDGDPLAALQTAQAHASIVTVATAHDLDGAVLAVLIDESGTRSPTSAEDTSSTAGRISALQTDGHRATLTVADDGEKHTFEFDLDELTFQVASGAPPSFMPFTGDPAGLLASAFAEQLPVTVATASAADGRVLAILVGAP